MLLFVIADVVIIVSAALNWSWLKWSVGAQMFLGTVDARPMVVHLLAIFRRYADALRVARTAPHDIH